MTRSSEELGRQAVGVLNDVLEPLKRHYKRDDVSEIAVNAPGVCFHRLRTADRLGRHWRRADDPALDHGYLTLALHTLANVYREPFDGDLEQTLFGELPDGERLSAVAGRGVTYDGTRPEGGVALCIRQSAKGRKLHDLDGWGVARADERWSKGEVRDQMREITSRSDGIHDRLCEAARKGKPFLLSGATNTGKTSLINRLLAEMEDDTRIVTVEDTQEVIVPVPNRVHLIIEREEKEGTQERRRLTAKQARNVITRFSPEAVLVGEISPDNAGLAIELLRSGHHHFWTSIHAGSVDEAVTEFAKLAIAGQRGRSVEEVQGYIRSSFTIIQTQMVRGERVIQTVQEAPEAHSEAGDPEAVPDAAA